MTTFACIDDNAPTEVFELLREAAHARGITFAHIETRTFDFAPERQLAPGDLLYRAGGTMASIRVERFIDGPGVATFYGGSSDRGSFLEAAQPLLFERAGIPVAPAILCASADHALLDGFAARLGGYPLLAKMGGSAGVGVVMIDSAAALYSFAAYASRLGREPLLSKYLRDGVLWRVVVIGDAPLVAYTCYADPGDFRATKTTGASVFTAHPPDAIGTLAVRAVRACELEFGGVDILECPDGRYVLECNFPCFFPLAQLRAGVDVAGPMVDYLLRKAR